MVLQVSLVASCPQQPEPDEAEEEQGYGVNRKTNDVPPNHKIRRPNSALWNNSRLRENRESVLLGRWFPHREMPQTAVDLPVRGDVNAEVGWKENQGDEPAEGERY